MPSLGDVPVLEAAEDGYVIKWGSDTYRIPRLKHGVLFLMSGHIASQLYYCEYRIHLDYTRGRIIGLGALEGFEEHSRQLGIPEEDYFVELGWNPMMLNKDAEGISFFNEKMRRWIGRLDMSKPYLEEASLLMIVNNVPILGLPDLIVNDHGRLVIELKTTNNPRSLGKVGMRDLVQAEFYVHMLNNLGIPTRGAGVLKLLRGGRFRLLERINDVIDALESMEPTSLGDAVLFPVKVRGFGEFLRDLERALEYWLGLRNPKPAPAPSRCRPCDHVNHCPYATLVGHTYQGASDDSR